MKPQRWSSWRGLIDAGEGRTSGQRREEEGGGNIRKGRIIKGRKGEKNERKEDRTRGEEGERRRKRNSDKEGGTGEGRRTATLKYEEDRR